ncbi:MAG: hypothetical protein R3E32_08940 [Chitinophagales bacterium]
MFTFKKIKIALNKYLLTKKETNFIKGGFWVDREKGKSHGCPPPFGEE